MNTSKSYEVMTRSSACGIEYTVFVREGGKCVECITFHANQGMKVKSPSGVKVFQKYKLSPATRCEIFCAELEKEGYARELSAVEKEAREICALIEKTYSTDEDRKAALENVLSNIPSNKNISMEG